MTNNHTIAKVFLKPGSQGLPQHQNRQFRYLDRRKHSDENEDAFLNDSTLIQNGFSADSNDVYNRKNHPNQHQVVYRFAIGSIDSFEKKLEEAQKAVGINPLNEIPVQYANETTTKSEILSVLPSLLLMGAALYFMRFAAGSMGGGAGRGGGMGGKHICRTNIRRVLVSFPIKSYYATRRVSISPMMHQFLSFLFLTFNRHFSR